MRLLIAACLAAGSASAEVPHVAADILPVHGLVAKVMEGLGTPGLLVSPAASPHVHALRPSEARTLSDADLVIVNGGGLTPWLPEAAESLAPGADMLELMALPGTEVLGSRGGAVFDARSGAADSAHDEHGDHEDEHGHDGHGDEHDAAHGEEHDAAHEDAHGEERAQGDEHAHEDAHDHGDEDPHGWLSPANAAVWMSAIAEDLAARDPANAETYRANAAAGAVRIEATRAEVAARLEPFGGRDFVVMHDALGYFEDSFGLSAAAALSLSDAASPGAARLRALGD